MSLNRVKLVHAKEKPTCFGKFEATSKTNKKQCGLCPFVPYCKEGKMPPNQQQKRYLQKRQRINKIESDNTINYE